MSMNLGFRALEQPTGSEKQFARTWLPPEVREKKTDLKPRHYYREKNQFLMRKMKTTENIRCCPNSQVAKQKLQPLKNGTGKSPYANRKAIGKINVQENEQDKRQVAYKREAQIEFFIEIYMRLQPIHGGYRPPFLI
jgi:hypothetical protein